MSARQPLAPAALEVQHSIGWAGMPAARLDDTDTSHSEAVLELARLVHSLALEVDRLAGVLERVQPSGTVLPAAPACKDPDCRHGINARCAR